jgi:hypothetical protein
MYHTPLTHSHPRDSRITFVEDTHTYYIDKSSDGWKSCTTFIKSFFSPFDPDTIITKMITSGSINKNYSNKLSQEIKDAWTANGAQASGLGTTLHLCIENYFNRVPDPVPSDVTYEWSLFERWWETASAELIPVRSEWRVFTEDYKISGSIDMIFELPNGHYAIYDWKRSKEIKFENKYGKGLEPLTHLDDCNFNHYTLQLNLYQFILETKYDCIIDVRRLVIMHPNNSEAIVIDCPDRQNEIRSMLEFYKKYNNLGDTI